MEQGFVPHIKHPNPWNLQGRDEPLNYLALKQQAFASRRAITAVTNTLTCPGTQYKSSGFKRIYAICEREPLTDFKAPAGGQEATGTLSGNKGAGGRHFVSSLYFDNVGRHHFCLLPLTWHQDHSQLARTAHTRDIWP